MAKKALHQSGALLGGEYSSHMFLKHRWYGFDDGLYAAARFLEIMDKHQTSADSILASLPSSSHTPELFVPLAENEKFAVMKTSCAAFSLPDAEINTLDGLRVSLENAWGLIRVSNTTPNLMLRFEAQSAEALEDIMDKFQLELLRILPELKLNF